MAKKIIDDGLSDIEDLSQSGRSLNEDDEPDEPGSSDDDALEVVFADEAAEGADSDDENHESEDGNAPMGDPDEYAEEEPDDNADDPEDKTKESESEEEDDDSGYSKKVRKRIERERRLKEEARQRAEAAEARLAELEAKQAESTIEDRLNKAIEELEDARRDADTRKEATAQARVTRLVAEQEELAKRKAAESDRKGGDQPLSPAYKQWIERNQWFEDKRYAGQRAAAIAKAQELLATGDHDDKTPEFYRALDRELRKVIVVPGRKPPSRDAIPRIPMGERRSGSKTRVVLTPDDRRLMKGLKLDPTNKADVLAYAREKRNG